MKRGAEKQPSLSAATEQSLFRLLDDRSPGVGAAALDLLSATKVSDSPQVRAAVRKASGVARNSETELDSRLNAVRVLGMDPTRASHPGAQEPACSERAAKAPGCSSGGFVAHRRCRCSRDAARQVEDLSGAGLGSRTGGVLRESPAVAAAARRGRGPKGGTVDPGPRAHQSADALARRDGQAARPGRCWPRSCRPTARAYWT